MSRSRKKAIYKDKGHRKEDYWRVHRRVNKQITKHFIDSAREFVNCRYDEWDEFFKFKEYFIQKGMNPEDAHLEAYYHIEDDVSFGKISSDLYRLWWESPEYILPKALVNDYDYSDFRMDYEFDRMRGYYRDLAGDKDSEAWREEWNSWAEKLRRK